MPSNRFVSLKATLSTLRTTFIVTTANYSQYTAADHELALAFRILASAHIEEFAEERCKDVAKQAMADLEHGRKTRAACVLVSWFVANGQGGRGDIPLDPTEVAKSLVAKDALAAFLATVESSHGVSGQKLRNMTFRLGLVRDNLDDQLVDTLTTLAEDRGKAAHTRVKRVRSMTEPKLEWDVVSHLLSLLESFDDEMDKLLVTV